MTRANDTADVVVLGAGAAGLTTALAAADAGGRVLLLERSAWIGGTMAQSAGVVWVPGNHHAAEPDSRADALRYLEALSNDRIDPVLAERYVDTAPEMLRWLESATGLTFGVLPYPDYHSEHPGAAGEGGRSVEPGLFAFGTLGAWADKVVISPAQRARVSLRPTETPYGGGTPPAPEVLAGRAERDERAWGQALVGGLLGALLERGVEPVTGVRATGLERDDTGRVVGVRDEHGRLYRARRGVVIATGGFDHNDQLKRAYLRGPLTASVAVPENTGDGLLMAQAVGAGLSGMSEAWWVPIMNRPGEVTSGGRAFPRTVTVVFERSWPGSIIVNRAGRRFCNEAANYNAVMGGFHALDPNSFSFANLPAYLIFDVAFRDRVPIADLPPGDRGVPDWMWTGATLPELARQLDVDGEGLAGTVARFNKHVADGRDHDFHRGETRFERANGDLSRPGPLANLGPLEQPPFYAVELLPGAFGTRGGPVTDENSRVLDTRGEPVPGLYAAGNAMASVLGMSYPGGGGTLGSAFTFGYLAGQHAARSSEGTSR